MRRLLLFLLLSASAAFADDPAIDIAAVLAKIRSGSPSECVEAVGKLTAGKEERAAKPIAIRLVTESDAQAKAVLRDALAAYKGATLVQAVKTGLETKGVTDDFRTMTLELLAKEKSETAVTLVGKIAFESEMKAMREAGQKALVAYGNEGVKPAATWIRSPDQKIASEAVQVLKAFNSEEAGKALAGCMADGGDKEIQRILGITSKTRDQAAKALIDMGDPSVPGLLAGLDNALYSRWCAYCLQYISGEKYIATDKASWVAWWKKRLAEKAGK